MDASRRPVDFDGLQDGTVIDSSHIAKVYQATPGTEEYRLKMMSLAGEIERYFAENNKPMLVRFRKNSLYIVSNDQMVDVLESRQRRNLKGIARGVVQSTRMDRSQLSEAHVSKLDRLQHVGSRLAGAARLFRRETPQPLPNPKKIGPAWSETN